MTATDVYREELMDLYKSPAHRGKVDNPSASMYAKNPMCGDEVTLTLKVTDGLITEAKFDGSACAVSVISSELLTDFILGKSIDEIKRIDKDALLKLTGLNLSTSRVKCATLILDALKESLEKYGTKTDQKTK